MQTCEIPSDQWHTFFADFTRLHQDEHVNVETMRQLDHGVESRLCDLPLLGIVSAKQHGREEWIEVVVARGTSGPPATHSITKPSRVCVAEEHGDAVALQVDSEDGLVTTIRFEPPRENMPAGFTVSQSVGQETSAMPWKIIRSQYDPLDPSTLHDDEMIAIEAALGRAAQRPSNETNPSWRAWREVHPLAATCTGDGDPVNLLPPAARASPVWSDYPHDEENSSAQPPPVPPVSGL